MCIHDCSRRALRPGATQGGTQTQATATAGPTQFVDAGSQATQATQAGEV
jgi:hypothetical protein